jgi:hydrogenase maturation protease
LRYLIGIGNYQMSDDGVGLRLVEYIVEKGLEKGFEAVDIADEGTRLLFYLRQETERIVLIDAVDMGLPAGDYRLFEPADVRSARETRGLSTHEGDALKILEFARTIGYFIPPLIILGIQPGSMAPGMELSPALQERFDSYLGIALEEIGKDE